MPSKFPKPGQSLADLYPEIATQADGWDPTTVKAQSNKMMAWKCKLGHTWETKVNNRSNGKNCPFCTGRKILVGFNDLATSNPELAAQAHGWDPTTLMAFSQKKVGWKCELGHVWEATVGSRSAGNGCPTCAGKIPVVGKDDLATTHPEIAAQAYGWDPTTVKAGSERVVAWMCSEAHTWNASVFNLVRNNSCPTCRGTQVLTSYNDLATTHPELAAQAHGWDPSTISAKSKTESHRSWICKQGHTWEATLANRSRGTGCPTCAGQKTLAGFNDLATTNPELAAQADGWDPTTLMAFTNKKVKWICQLGHRWEATVNSRSSGSGCPSCAKFGFKPEQEAWMYLVYDDVRDVLQLGITNNREERLTKHRRSGFDQVLDVRGPIDGVLARDLERECLRSLTKRNAKFVKDIDMERFDGWTESWTKDSLDVSSFRQLLDWVYEDDELGN